MSAELLAHINSVDLGSLSDHGGLALALDIANNKLAVAGRAAAADNDTGVSGVSGRFTAALTDLNDPVNQTDVLESMLFAQLVASGKYNAFDDPPKWYQTFVGQLTQVAWTNVELKFAEASISGNKVAVKDIVLAFLTSSGVAQAAKDLIYSLSLPGAARAHTIFNKSAAKGRASTFALASVTQAGQNVELKGGAFYFTAQYDVLDVLFFTLDRSSSKFFQSNFTSILSVPTYANGIREAVKARIKGHAIDYIAKAPLADAP